jgi:hypothetical protein
MDTELVSPLLTVIPARDVLTVDGLGAPEDPSFTRAVRALLAVRAALGGRGQHRPDPTARTLHVR